MSETREGLGEGLVGTGLAYAYGRTEGLRGVDLSVAPGEIVAATGPSGSGKSTLLLLLAGVLLPDEGEVTFESRVLSRLSEAQRSALRRTEIGIVFQFGQLVPELTAAENVALPLILGGARRASALERATDVLGSLDVADLAATRPTEMSGGQMQRVAVARALVTRPRVILADEPTGALNSLAGEAVMRELVGAARGRGASLVIATHDARVAAHADREIRLLDGRVDSENTGSSAPLRSRPGVGEGES
ncbi:ABC transporter ATP-binding protein [Actinomycetota bacterium]